MTAMTTLTLISHHLCPYVQRVAIALADSAPDSTLDRSLDAHRNACSLPSPPAT